MCYFVIEIILSTFPETPGQVPELVYCHIFKWLAVQPVVMAGSSPVVLSGVVLTYLANQKSVVPSVVRSSFNPIWRLKYAMGV